MKVLGRQVQLLDAQRFIATDLLLLESYHCGGHRDGAQGQPEGSHILYHLPGEDLSLHLLAGPGVIVVIESADRRYPSLQIQSLHQVGVSRMQVYGAGVQEHECRLRLLGTHYVSGVALYVGELVRRGGTEANASSRVYLTGDEPGSLSRAQAPFCSQSARRLFQSLPEEDPQRIISSPPRSSPLLPEAGDGSRISHGDGGVQDSHIYAQLKGVGGYHRAQFYPESPVLYVPSLLRCVAGPVGRQAVCGRGTTVFKLSRCCLIYELRLPPRLGEADDPGSVFHQVRQQQSCFWSCASAQVEAFIHQR